MKPEELRIGNWVKYRGEPVKVEQLRVNCLGIANSDVLVDYNEIQPIELTEEVLKKIGFEECGLWSDFDIYEYEKENGSFEYITIKREVGYETATLSIRFFKDKNSEYCETTLRNIQHLHLLQNAYFITTDRELKIEL
jgi:hypothetical protein